MTKRLAIILFTFVCVFSVTSAQAIATCASIVEQAFEDVGTNCANQEINTVCYGYPDVQAEFIEDSESILEEASERASVLDLVSIATSPLNVQDEEYGIAVFRTQANLPTSSIDEEAVIMVAMGDVMVTNTVDEDNLVIPEVVVAVEIDSDEASLLSFPPNWGVRTSEEVATTEAGTSFDADAISSDGQWLRVAFEYDSTSFSSRRTAWISIDDVVASDGTASLAVMDASSLTPMQSFILMNEFDDPTCEEQPQSQLLIQGPSTIESELIIYGLDIRMTSTLITYVFPRNGELYLKLIPVTSYLVIPDPVAPDDIDRAIVVEAGQFIDVPLCLDLEGRPLICEDWVNSFAEQRQAFEDNPNYLNNRLTRLISLIRNIAENIFNYEIDQTPIIIQPSGVGSPAPIFDAFIPRPRDG